ncbi:MAG TPA: nitronate monooxygenase [Nevskiaceae bacterium]|nr:nitronate monooxygenase [Nevskiaceae bacterium]
MTNTWHQALGLRYPVMQAGMAGGLAGVELASAACKAGGLGTLGLSPPRQFRDELRQLRELCNGKPFAANLLMPFVRRSHVDACIEMRPTVVSLFYGFDRAIVDRLKRAGIFVLHQVGDLPQAQRAIADGADGLIVQGAEAGGHLAGDARLSELLPAIRAAIRDRPLLAAGGIFDAGSARAAASLGADGVAAGTRFLLTPESNAHDEYKHRLLAAKTTVRTSLFGLAWPAPHRVVPNAATERWTKRDADGPRWAQAISALMVPARRVLPMESVIDLVANQRVAIPLYSPAALTKELDAGRADVTPLYAGECVANIDALMPAADVVRELASAFEA